MIFQSNTLKKSLTKIVIGSIEQLTLPFQPVSQLKLDLQLPYFPGTKVIKVNFSDKN